MLGEEKQRPGDGGCANRVGGWVRVLDGDTLMGGEFARCVTGVGACELNSCEIVNFRRKFSRDDSRAKEVTQ